MPTLSVRLPMRQFAALRFAASRYNATPSRFVRHVLAAATDAPTGPVASKIRDCAIALDLPPDSPPDVVLDMLRSIVDELDASETPDPASDAAAPYTGLSASDREKLDRMTPEQRQRFAALRATRATPVVQLSAGATYELTDAEKRDREKLPTKEQRDEFTARRVAKGLARQAEAARKKAARKGNILG